MGLVLYAGACCTLASIYALIPSTLRRTNIQCTTQTVMAQQPEHTTPMEPSGSWHLDSPLVYLYGGIGAMLAIIMVAFLMLARSQWRNRSSDGVAGGDESLKAARHVCNHADGVNDSTQIVVIMAGEEQPTYLAAPANVPRSRGCTIHLSNRSL